MYPKYQKSKTGNYKVYIHYIPQTGKRYVGVTGQRLSKRFQSGFGYEKNEGFFADIKKYGWDSVQTTVVAETSDFYEASRLEGENIEKYDTLNPEHGYNLWSSGADNAPLASVGKHISEAKMGHEVTPETRAKLSQYGRKKVVQLTPDGEYVKTFESMTEAAKSVDIPKSCIYSVCKGQRPTSRGYKWMYLSDYEAKFRSEAVPC